MRKMKYSEWLGDIPTHWKIVRGKNIFQQRFEKGNLETVLLSATQKYGMYPQNLVEGVVQVSENTDLQTFKTVHKNDYVISLRSFQGGFEFSNFEGVCSPAYQVFFARIEINFLYYKYLFKSDGFIAKMNSLTVGIREGKNIQFKDFGNSYIPLPPLAEQKKIAAYLDKKCSAIDSIIDKEQKLIEKLKDYKQSLITETVTKGLNPDAPTKDSGIEWIGDIPKHWNSDTVYRCIKFEGGSQPDLSFFINEPRLGYVRLIQNRDYKTDDYATYVPENMVKKFCTKDDVMIGRYGPPLFVIHRGLEGAYNVAMFKAIPINLDREFMYFYLQNLTLVKYVESFSERTAGQSGVNPIIFKKYPIFIPPMNEQKLIADYLYEQCDKIDKNISKRQALIEKLNEYKKSLIYEVVTGKVEV